MVLYCPFLLSGDYYYVLYSASPAEAAGGSDAIIIVTEWKEFSDPLIYGGKLVVDGRGVTKTSNYEGICW